MASGSAASLTSTTRDTASSTALPVDSLCCRDTARQSRSLQPRDLARARTIALKLSMYSCLRNTRHRRPHDRLRRHFATATSASHAQMPGCDRSASGSPPATSACRSLHDPAHHSHSHRSNQNSQSPHPVEVIDVTSQPRQSLMTGVARNCHRKHFNALDSDSPCAVLSRAASETAATQDCNPLACQARQAAHDNQT